MAQLLSQMEYEMAGKMPKSAEISMGGTGLEPATFGM